jgi:hypothetical protein
VRALVHSCECSYMYEYLYLYCVSKKTTRNQLIFVRIDETVRDRFYQFFENRPVKFEIFNPTNGDSHRRRGKWWCFSRIR